MAFAQAIPTLSPVYEPGPLLTAIRPISSGSTPNDLNISSREDTNAFPWRIPLSKLLSLSVLESSQRATLPTNPDVSMPRTFIFVCRINSGNGQDVALTYPRQANFSLVILLPFLYDINPARTRLIFGQNAVRNKINDTVQELHKRAIHRV